ncbi:MAG: ABC transporter ATP-binding protein [Phormidesmis sp.]
MSPLIQFKKVSKLYGTGNTEVRALWEVDMTINQGEYCAIMGPSGSGKSTAMNMVGCLDQPTSGDYLFDGQNVAQLLENNLAHIRNRKIGFVFQQFHLLNHLTAQENVEQPMMYAGIPSSERRERAAHALTQVGLSDRLRNRPNQLSGGQQQRVAIARAIVNEPLLLLADEPTGALDTQTTQDVIDIFSKLNDSGITVVMVTHEPEVARLTKRVIWFRDGEVMNHDLDPNELMTVSG